MDYYNYDLLTKTIEDVRTDADNNYPQFIQIDPSAKYADYIGLGVMNANMHVYLAIICTLPLFENCSEARDTMILNFGWERKFENYSLKDEFATSEKMIKFLSTFRKIHWNSLESFFFKPKQLDAIVTLIKDKLPNPKTPFEIIQDVFDNCYSPARLALLKLSIKSLKKEKKDLAHANWKKAKDELKHFHLVKFIKLIWNNISLRSDTNRLIAELRTLNNVFINDRQFFDVNLFGNRCQITHKE